MPSFLAVVPLDLEKYKIKREIKTSGNGNISTMKTMYPNNKEIKPMSEADFKVHEIGRLLHLLN